MSMNIVPIIAVDFSLANLTFDETQYCIHTLKENAPNDYLDAIQATVKAFENYSRFYLPIGFGAKTLNQKDEESPTCNLFSMTGDIKDMVCMKDDLRKTYERSIKSVQLSLPVLFNQILKFCCDLAQEEIRGGNFKTVNNYYVVVLLMAGMIDDFKDALK